MEKLDYLFVWALGIIIGFCTFLCIAINDPRQHKAVQTVSQIEKTEFYTDQGLRI